jgi:CheY-like chemotaxis protein
MTGWNSEEDRRIAQEAGFDFYLTKPVDAEKISRLLGQPRPASEESGAQ